MKSSALVDEVNTIQFDDIQEVFHLVVTTLVVLSLNHGIPKDTSGNITSNTVAVIPSSLSFWEPCSKYGVAVLEETSIYAFSENIPSSLTC